MKSDVYALGLLMWQIMLNGLNPFQTLPEFSHFQNSDRQFDHIQKLKEAPGFFHTVLGSLQGYLISAELHEVKYALEDCLQLDPMERSLESAMKALGMSVLQ